MQVHKRYEKREWWKTERDRERQQDWEGGREGTVNRISLFKTACVRNHFPSRPSCVSFRPLITAIMESWALCSYTLTHTHTLLTSHAHTHARARTHAHAHTHTHTHTHIYAVACWIEWVLSRNPNGHMGGNYNPIESKADFTKLSGCQKAVLSPCVCESGHEIEEIVQMDFQLVFSGKITAAGLLHFLLRMYLKHSCGFCDWH